MLNQRPGLCEGVVRVDSADSPRVVVRGGGYAVVPTAQRVPLGVTVIPCNRLLELLLFGLDTKLQLDPFQCSLKVC